MLVLRLEKAEEFAKEVDLIHLSVLLKQKATEFPVVYKFAELKSKL